MADLVSGIGILAARDLRFRTHVAQRQRDFLVQLIDRIRRGGSALSFFEDRALGVGQRVGDVATARLAESEIAASKRIAQLSQERGLLGSGSEMAAQRANIVDFSRLRADAAASLSRERLQQEMAATFGILGQASSFTGSQSPAGFVLPSLQNAAAQRGQGNPLTGALFQTGGALLGNFLFPGAGGAAGGGFLGSLFGGGQQSAQTTQPSYGISRPLNVPSGFSYGNLGG